MVQTENTQAREMGLPILSATLNPVGHVKKQKTKNQKLENDLGDKCMFEISVLPWVWY